MKRYLCLLLSLLMLSLCCISFADNNSIMADPFFDVVTGTLKTDKSVSFSCSTYATCSSIYVSQCWLQRRVGNYWIYTCALTPPSYVATNTDVYNKSESYSSNIGSGTFRVGFTMNADGHTITRYSNSLSFN